MVKVLHLITWLNRGGIERWLLTMLGEMSRDECQMDVCCRGSEAGELAAEARALGSNVSVCPLQLDHVRFGRQLAQLLRDGQYDVLHNHLGVYSGYPTWIGHQVGVPVITQFHNAHCAPQAWTKRPVLRELRGVYARYSVRYALRHSDLIVGISQGLFGELEQVWGETGHNSRVVYYGVDIPDLPAEQDRAAFRRSLNWDDDVPVAIHVGSFRQEKNHRGLLQLFRQVVERMPQAKLLLVGDGPLRPEIEAMVSAHGIGQSVRLLGLRDDVPALLGYSDVMIMPSLTEGFGLAALEANAAGLAVVGSRIPGLSEAVADGETALLHDVEDLCGMCDSVVALLSDPARAGLMGRAGRRRADAEFSKRAAAGRLLEVYHECLRR